MIDQQERVTTREPAILLAPPYRGLAAYREEDAPLFNERQDVIHKLLLAVVREPILTLIGPAGCGKTPLLQASFLAQARKEHPDWLFTTLRLDAPPHLSFTLTQLWERQRDGHLTHAAYDEIGGVSGAPRLLAQRVYEHMSASEREQAGSCHGSMDRRRPRNSTGSRGIRSLTQTVDKACQFN
jgi:hypothetical protein